MKELQARDAVRKRLQAQKKKEMAEINALVRAEAEKRQADALATWLGFLQKRKDDYAAKCEVCFLFLTLLPEVCVFCVSFTPFSSSITFQAAPMTV